MSIKPADRKARSNYKAKVKRVTIELYPTDEDIKIRLDSLTEPTSTYIKRLIREDMKSEQE